MSQTSDTVPISSSFRNQTSVTPERVLTGNFKPLAKLRNMVASNQLTTQSSSTLNHSRSQASYFLEQRRLRVQLLQQERLEQQVRSRTQAQLEKEQRLSKTIQQRRILHDYLQKLYWCSREDREKRERSIEREQRESQECKRKRVASMQALRKRAATSQGISQIEHEEGGIGKTVVVKQQQLPQMLLHQESRARLNQTSVSAYRDLLRKELEHLKFKKQQELERKRVQHDTVALSREESKRRVKHYLQNKRDSVLENTLTEIQTESQLKAANDLNLLNLALIERQAERRFLEARKRFAEEEEKIQKKVVIRRPKKKSKKLTKQGHSVSKSTLATHCDACSTSPHHFAPSAQTDSTEITSK